jgi:hypothetical protein
MDEGAVEQPLEGIGVHSNGALEALSQNKAGEVAQWKEQRVIVG